MQSPEILQHLIGFDTTSRNSNVELMTFIGDLLRAHDIAFTLLPNDAGTKANLYATIGKPNTAGVMLSGHTDVVPVDGQKWTKPPFQLTEENGRYYGRGTADMKGFVASALSAALKAKERDLATPLHLGFSYDEELGCLGVHSMIEFMKQAPVRPAFCIVGEPTNLRVATGHKGKTAIDVTCTGREGHSALAPFALNALYLASDLIQEIRDLQKSLADSEAGDLDYDVPYTTLHVGKINGGTALNIVPSRCDLSFEIRNIESDDPLEIFDEIQSRASRIVENAHESAPEADIAMEVFNAYPGLATPEDASVVEFVRSLTGANGTCKVAFGTEGGLFSQELGIPTVVCGPGSMTQGHKPDEYIEIEQVQRCDAMLEKLIGHLQRGLQMD